MSDRFMTFMVRLAIWLLGAALGRYVAITNVTDRLFGSRITWFVVFISAIAIAAVTGALFGASIALIFCALYRRWNIKPKWWLISLWEAMVWLDVQFIVIAIIEVAVGVPSGPQFLVRQIGSLLTWIGIMYMMVDLLIPPRKRRKRKKAPAPAKVQFEGITT